MNAQRRAIKLFATRPIARDALSSVNRHLPRFIQQPRSGLLIDVADYAHFPDGPGVILIGHDVDYGIDLRFWRTVAHDPQTRGRRDVWPRCSADTLAKALATARAIEADDSAPVAFRNRCGEIAFPDRRAAPNTALAYELVCKELAPSRARGLRRPARFENEAGSEPRRMRTLRLSGAAADPAPLETSRSGETPVPVQSPWTSASKT